MAVVLLAGKAQVVACRPVLAQAQAAGPGAAAAPPDRSEHFVLRWLQGDWRFKRGRRAGVRRYSLVLPGHALTWTETFDGSDLIGQGHIGLLPDGRWASSSLHNRQGAIDQMVGRANAAGTEIVYRSLLKDPPKTEIVWRRTSDKAFVYEAVDIRGPERRVRWTAYFRRLGGADQLPGSNISTRRPSPNDTVLVAETNRPQIVRP